MTPACTRLATAADLPAMYEIWYQDEVGSAAETPPRGRMLGSLVYEVERRLARVAESDDGRVIGFGASLTWPSHHGSLTYLSDLFISPAAQSHGAGQAIMESLPLHEGARCVMASTDPRASALYIRWGMRPRWPNYWLAASQDWGSGALHALPGGDVTVALADPADPALARWDSDTCGFERERDLAWMVSDRDAFPVWFRRDGATLGYAYLQRKSDESLWQPDAWTIGPVGARTGDSARDCVGAAVRYAAAHAPAVRLNVPGPHLALPDLIHAGMRIVYVETFMASEGGQTFDPTLYAPGGVFL